MDDGNGEFDNYLDKYLEDGVSEVWVSLLDAEGNEVTYPGYKRQKGYLSAHDLVEPIVFPTIPRAYQPFVSSGLGIHLTNGVIVGKAEFHVSPFLGAGVTLEVKDIAFNEVHRSR